MADYYTRTQNFAAGTKAKGEHVRDELDAVAAAFTQLPAPGQILTPSTVTPYVTQAQWWANYPEDQLVPGTNEYSAYHYSQKSAAQVALAANEVTNAQAEVTKAGQYADYAENTVIPGTSRYSAYHYSQKAAEQVALAAAEVVNAQQEVTNAQAEVTKAGQYADYAENTVVPGTSRYSAYHYSQKSAASATAAANSAGVAADQVPLAQAEVVNAQAEVAKAANYASYTAGTLVPGTSDYSALHWSVVSSQYAVHPEDTQIPGTTDFSARHWALYAEQQAATVDGAIVWGGQWDAGANGTPPTPAQPTRYIVTSDGTVDGKAVETNDTIIYDTVGAEWIVIPGNGQVSSVNGAVGAVTLDYDDFAGAQSITLNNNVALSGRNLGGTAYGLIFRDGTNATVVGTASYATRLRSPSGVAYVGDGTTYHEIISSAGGQQIDGNLVVTGNFVTDTIRVAGGQSMWISAGESNTHNTSANTGNNEEIHLAAEGGLKIYSSSDNWGTGWAGRHEASLVNSSGNSAFPGNVAAPSFTENGTALSSKYLGITAQAADSAKLAGWSQDANKSANTIARRDSSADIHARLFRSDYQEEATMTGAIAFRKTTSDNYIRFCNSPASVRSWLGALGSSEKAADSDKLDGVNSSSFMRSDANDTKTAGYSRFNDSILLQFGNSADGEIFHSGSHQYLDINTGDFYIRSGTTTKYLFDVSSGNFHADGHVYWQSGSVGSDPELKKNARLIDNPIRRLKKLNGWFFEWKEGKKGLTGGLMSPEIRKALPGTVRKTGGLSRKKKYDQFDYNCATGLLVEVGKNHEQRIAEQAQQIKQLEKVVRKLEKRAA